MVETTIALGLIFSVMLGLLASLDSGVRGLLTGRQRNVATAIAKEVIEGARALPYTEVGHDVANDPGLAADANISGTSPNYTYTPPGGSAEPLVAAGNNPSYPQHEWTETRDATTLTIRVYVTWVSVTGGDDQKRLTVEVDHGPSQYSGNAVPNLVRVSTYISVGGQSAVNPGAFIPSTASSGVVDAGQARVSVEGTLQGLDFDRFDAFLPVAHSDVSGRVHREAHASSTAARSELRVHSGSVSGETVSGTTASCNENGPSTSISVDNEGSSAPLVHDAAGPVSDSSCTVTAKSDLGIDLLWGTLESVSGVVSKGTVESCTTCSPVVGDGDGLMYATAGSELSESPTVTYLAGGLSGNMVSLPSGTASAETTIDVDPSASDELVTSSGRVAVPAANILSMLPAPVGYTSAVKVSAADVTATAQAGPTASKPSFGPSSGAPATVTIDAWETDGLGLGSYKTMTVTPGVPFTDTAHAGFTVVSASGVVVDVTLDTTVTAVAPTTACSPNLNCTGAIETAEASISDWLVVSLHFVSEELGGTVADLTITLTYGRAVAQAGYEP